MVERRGEKMKTIKVYIEGGVCTDVVIPKEFHDKLNYKNLQDQGSLWVDDIYEKDEDEAA